MTPLPLPPEQGRGGGSSRTRSAVRGAECRGVADMDRRVIGRLALWGRVRSAPLSLCCQNDRCCRQSTARPDPEPRRRRYRALVSRPEDRNLVARRSARASALCRRR